MGWKGQQELEFDFSLSLDYTVKGHDYRVYSIDKEEPLKRLGL